MNKNRTRPCGVAALFATLVVSAPVAKAQGNSVFIESKTVLPGQTGVTVGAYISNAVPATAIVLPFEFRTVGSATGPHAYTHGPVTRAWNPLGRVDTSVLGPASLHSDPAYIVNHWYPVRGGVECSGPVSGTYTAANATPDNVSPDGCLFAAVSTGCGPGCDGDIDLDPGFESVGVDAPSFLIQFDVNTVQGQFEIDTCCVGPANHLFYIDRNTSIVPFDFTKGVITIGCECACLGDPVCDGTSDVLDLIETINVAFRGVAGITDSDCMFSRDDLNASGETDIVDVSLMVSAVYRGELIGTVVTNPCQ